MFVLRFLALVIILNIARYGGGFVFEQFLIFPGLFAAMTESADYFRTEFTTFDWVTSYLYNFVMWLCCAWMFHWLRPATSGSDLTASLKVFAAMCLMFAAVSFIYMNHYSHPRDFYLWSVADAILVFALVAVVNGLLYRRLLGPYAAAVRD